ncbi:MAG: anaerobic carbon-monoxide dehydrogenase catalytic subunit [Firmicutes bacterium]|nr:anaerobic carbon-monoxide dehydrogenase catalytic subunit [Bacillota bacterium]
MKYKYNVPLLNAEMPGKEDVQKLTPNPATQELLEKMDCDGCETCFDRFERQQPQCGFGLRGLCCRMCQWGPCRISEKNPTGICGKDQNAVIISNILRALVAGLSAHARHAHEIYLSIRAAATGKAAIPLRGTERLLDLAGRFGIDATRPVTEIAGQVTDILLADLSRMEAEPMTMLAAYAPQERQETWERLGVIPRSAAYEVMEALHMTTLGGCSDWRAMAAQELRAALAYCYSTLFGSSLATEILYGIPKPRVTTVNYGVLKAEYVNILVHGHSPVMVEKILEKLSLPEIQARARELGAAGIVIAGLCCTGDELLARYGISTVTNIMGQELALGTGAVDAVVVDMQCVLPSMQQVAACYGTRLITTCSSNRIPGAVHIPFDPEKPEQLDEDALEVARLAVEAYAARDRSRIRIPEATTAAVSGWSYEAIMERFGGPEQIVRLLQEGKIKGLATVVGCNNPKVPYEYNHVTIAKKLIAGGILVTTTGCSSHALLNAGLCTPAAAEMAAPALAQVCRELDIPPVLAVGGCVDNARTLRLFIDVAAAAGRTMPEMPYLFVGPEPGNEKTVGQGVSFLAHGISNVIGFPAPIPVPLPRKKEGAVADEDLERGSNDIADFFAGEGLQEKVGAKVYTEPYPELAAQTAKMHIKRKRQALGWE